MKFLHAVLLAVALGTAGCEACFNSTGGCLPSGKFKCMDGTEIDGAKRCDGVDDCPDALDEFKCPALGSTNNAHEAHEEASCGPTCACMVGETSVPNSATVQFTEAVMSPIWDTLMTGTPTPENGLMGCNPDTAKTGSVGIKVYKKGDGSCTNNVHKRGFVCCIRQISCTCIGAGSGPRCR